MVKRLKRERPDEDDLPDNDRRCLACEWRGCDDPWAAAPGCDCPCHTIGDEDQPEDLGAS